MDNFTENETRMYFSYISGTFREHIELQNTNYPGELYPIAVADNNSDKIEKYTDLISITNDEVDNITEMIEEGQLEFPDLKN